MVKKLMKHELFSMLRIAVFPVAALLLCTVFLRLSMINIEENTPMFALSMLFYTFALTATILVGFIFGISSFYKAFFTGEGYLTLALPVTADQLIWSKLLSAIIIMAASYVICALSFLIFLIGQPESVVTLVLQSLSEAFEFLGFAFRNDPLLCVEFIIYLIVQIPYSLLTFYAVMSVGQLFTAKNRSGIAILLYFAYVFVTSTLNSMLFTPLMAALENIKLIVMIEIILTAAADVGFYFLVRYIIRNKVNLIT